MTAALRIVSDNAPSHALGPAIVVDRGPGWVDAKREDGAVVRATIALGYRYDAEIDDVLLVIGDGDRAWVIGVVAGRGRSSIEAPGDLELRAAGTISIAGDKGVRLVGEEIEIAPSRLRVTASSLVETLGNAFRRVTGMLSTKAGETHTIVDGQATARAKNLVVLTDETASIDGQQIRLG